MNNKKQLEKNQNWSTIGSVVSTFAISTKDLIKDMLSVFNQQKRNKKSLNCQQGNKDQNFHHDKM